MEIIRTSAASVVSSGPSSGAYLTPHEVHLAQPTARPPDYHHALSAARRRVIAAGQWTADQLMGRRWPIGCVALEITQRCNLDCTACYLSEHSEAVKDIPRHARCNRYGMIFVANNRAYDALDDRRFLEAILDRMPLLSFDRRSRSKLIATFMTGVLTSPYLSFKAVGWLVRKAWQARADLWAARYRVNKLSFVIHDFMDACRLERDRVDACAFMAMTQRGPISMCLHNAKRDAFILAPVRLSGPEGDRLWNPISGEPMEKSAGMQRPPDPLRKAAKGRVKRPLTADDAIVR